MVKVAILEKRMRQENSMGYFPQGTERAMSFADTAYSSLYLLPIREPFLYMLLF